MTEQPPRTPDDSTPPVPSRFGAGGRFGAGHPPAASQDPTLHPVPAQMPARGAMAPTSPTAAPHAPTASSASIHVPTSAAEVERPEILFPAWLKIRTVISDEVTEQMTRHGERREAELRDKPGALQALIAEVVGAHRDWEVSTSGIPRLVRFMHDQLFGLGIMDGYLKIKGLEEIECNRHDEVFAVINGHHEKIVPSPFASDEETRSFVDRVARLQQGRKIDLTDPILSGQLPDGSRIEAVIPPITDETTFAIRKHSERVFTVEDYIKTDMFSAEFFGDLKKWIRQERNIVVSGGTGSGKAQPLDAKVLTPTGFVLIGDLVVDDTILSAHGAEATVTGVFPQGHKPCFEVAFAEGQITRCCDEHLWSVRDAHTRQPFTVRSLREIMTTGVLDEQGKPRFEIPRHTTGGAEWVEENIGLPCTGIRQIDPCEMVCISTSAPDQLYVTDDYIVTHNTSFLNFVGSLLPASSRLMIIEDTKELRMKTDNTVQMTTFATGSSNKRSSEGVDVERLLQVALRYRPDRIIIGEVRNHVAFDMLQALSTGHEGSLTTIHANNPIGAISRLRALAMSAGTGLPEEAILSLIASQIDLVVQVGRFSGTPYRKVLDVWQFFEEEKLNEDGLELFARLQAEPGKSGLLHVFGKGPLWGLPLYKRHRDGRHIKLNEMIPVISKADFEGIE